VSIIVIHIWLQGIESIGHTGLGKARHSWNNNGIDSKIRTELRKINIEQNKEK
jgi:hypothetical protein